MNLRVINSGSYGNAYVLKGASQCLILDAGVHIGEIMAAVDRKPSSIVGVLITHEHSDHTRAVKELMVRGVDIYCSQGTAEALGLANEYKVKVVQSNQIFSIGEFKIYPFPVVHDAKEPLGFLVVSGSDKILYATDTAYIKHIFKGVTHLIVECNYMPADLMRTKNNLPAPVRRRIAESHMSVENLAEYIKKMDSSMLQQIILAHISEDRGDANAMKYYIELASEGVPVDVAVPGYTYNDEF